MLYGVQIRRIWRKILKEAASSFNRLLNSLRFMKRGVVHDNNSSVWKHRQKTLQQPCFKNICIDGTVKKSCGQHLVFG